MRLTPEERSQFKRELPVILLLLLALFVALGVMLSQIPPVAVQS